MKKKTVWPSKTTLNLYVRERSKISFVRLVPLSLMLVLCVGVFSKFAVAERFSTLDRARDEVAQLRSELELIQVSTADFETVQEQFRRHSYGSFSESELALVDRMAVLDLFDAVLAPAGTVRSLAVSDDRVSLSLEGITLEQSSLLVAKLLQNPIVADVAVDSAGYGAADAYGVRPSVTAMNITLSGVTKGGEG